LRTEVHWSTAKQAQAPICRGAAMQPQTRDAKPIKIQNSKFKTRQQKKEMEKGKKERRVNQNVRLSRIHDCPPKPTQQEAHLSTFPVVLPMRVPLEVKLGTYQNATRQRQHLRRRTSGRVNIFSVLFCRRDGRYILAFKESRSSRLIQMESIIHQLC
jgi:hypothetical protein